MPQVDMLPRAAHSMALNRQYTVSPVTTQIALALITEKAKCIISIVTGVIASGQEIFLASGK
jgi:hypothetical protein